MALILLLVKYQSALVYMDDVVVILKSAQEHLTSLRRALWILQNVGVTLKSKTFSFFAEAIDYPYNFIRPGRLLSVETKTK